MEEYVTEALQQELIRKFTSPTSTSFFFVHKKGCSLRPYINYQGLNAVTVNYFHPHPLVTATVEQLPEV